MIRISTFIALSRLTDEGRKTIKSNPDRIKEVNAEIHDIGGDVLDQYLVFGQYDFVSIIRAPDDLTMARISLEIGSRGTLELETLKAIRFEDLLEKI